MNGVRALKKGTPERGPLPLLPRGDTGRTQPSVNQEALTGLRICRHGDPGLPAPTTVRSQRALFRSPQAVLCCHCHPKGLPNQADSPQRIQNHLLHWLHCLGLHPKALFFTPPRLPALEEPVHPPPCTPALSPTALPKQPPDHSPLSGTNRYGVYCGA